MDASTIVRGARHRARISQRRFAGRAGVPQSNVSLIESGEADVTVGRLNRLLTGIGEQLVAIPSTAPTVAEWAGHIKDALASGSEPEARIGLVRLSDRLTSEDPAVRVALCVPTPPSTGHPGYDAALAGTVEFLLSRDGLPVPPWVYEIPPSPEPVYLTANPAVRDLVVEATPAVFRTRNVFVHPDYFDSV